MRLYFGLFNGVGWYSLYRKEIMRFLSVYIQTFLTPVVSAFLFLGITHLTLARLKVTVAGFTYPEFLVPGLSAMAMAMSAFSNPSFSILLARLQRNLSSIVMAPLSGFEFYSAYVVAAMTRGLITGGVVWVCLSMVTGFSLAHPFIFISTALVGSLLFAHLGYLAGLSASRFEHLSAVLTFGITPLTFLSGGFYLQSQLPPAIQGIAGYNPVFYFMDSVRFGTLGIREASVGKALLVLVLCNVVLGTIACTLTSRGYKLKQ